MFIHVFGWILMASSSIIHNKFDIFQSAFDKGVSQNVVTLLNIRFQSIWKISTFVTSNWWSDYVTVSCKLIKLEKKISLLYWFLKPTETLLLLNTSQKKLQFRSKILVHFCILLNFDVRCIFKSHLQGVPFHKISRNKNCNLLDSLFDMIF